MALKEQANKNKSPRNKNNQMRDGKPLGKAILTEENLNITEEDIFRNPS